MARRFDVAVLGAEGAVGEALLELLAERRFPAGEISALSLNPEDGQFLSVAGLELPVENAETFEFAQVQLAFLAEADEQLAAQAERAADAGCVVIDASGLAWKDGAIPVVVPELNPKELAAYNERGIVANPARLAVALALVLAPLHRLAGLRRVVVTALVPASDAGRPALEDLARETTALLNASFYERRHYPKQIAFNMLGQDGTAQADGRTATEARIATDLARLLQLESLAVTATLVSAPVFYGYGVSLEAEFEHSLAVSEAAAALAAAPGLELQASVAAEDCPAPVTEASGNERIQVGRLRHGGRGLALWFTADNIRRCAAANALGNAEILVRDYL